MILVVSCIVHGPEAGVGNLLPRHKSYTAALWDNMAARLLLRMHIMLAPHCFLAPIYPHFLPEATGRHLDLLAQTLCQC